MIPTALRNKTVKQSVNPAKPVPEPNVIIRSDGSPLKYPINTDSPNA